MSTYRMAKQSLLHPIDFYNDIQGIAKIHAYHSVVMVLLAVVVRLLSLSVSSFMYQTREPFQISIVVEAMIIIIPWFTWVVSNWGISTLQDGEGKFVEILVGSAFALTPYIVFTLPLALLTNLMSLGESTLYASATVIIFLWVGLLIMMQVKILHDFELSKTAFIAILSLIGMIIIWFMSILIYGLINQAVNFVFGLMKEISFRM